MANLDGMSLHGFGAAFMLNTPAIDDATCSLDIDGAAWEVETRKRGHYVVARTKQPLTAEANLEAAFAATQQALDMFLFQEKGEMAVQRAERTPANVEEATRLYRSTRSVPNRAISSNRVTT